MKISTSAWHYRYMRRLGFSAPRNLCPYFWKLMFSLMVPIFFAIFGVAVLVALVLIGKWIAAHLLATAIALGIVLGAVAIIFTIGWLIFSSASRTTFGRIGVTAMASGVGETLTLTGNYIHAVHSKFCPLLEFVGEDERPLDTQVWRM